MSAPLVSVKMITYNHAPYIAQAIEGVLRQKTDFPFELVIGEDCSTDGTRDIVFDYQKRHPDVIRVVTSERNVGMKQNSYRTSRACRGKYIAFCEGDDYWHRDEKLQWQVDYMEEHQDCALVHSDYDRYIVATQSVIRSFNRHTQNVVPAVLDACAIMRGGKTLYVLTCTVMVRRDLAQAIVESDPIVYQSDRYLIGDTPLWTEISLRAKTHYLDVSLATYRVQVESASKSRDEMKVLRFGQNIHELFMYLIDKYNLSRQEREYHQRRWAEYTLWLAFHQQDARLAQSVLHAQGSLNLKGRILLWGAQYPLVNDVTKAALRVYRRVRRLSV